MTYLRLTQAAQALGIAPETLRRWCERGRVRSLRLPGSRERRFQLSEIERLLAQMGRREGEPGEPGEDDPQDRLGDQ